MKLRDQATNSMDNTGGRVSGIVEDAQKAAAEARQKAMQAFETGYTGAMESVDNVSSQVRSRAAGAVDNLSGMGDRITNVRVEDVTSYARQHPVKVAAASMLIGLAIGSILWQRSYRRIRFKG
ncbi:MAG: hypothetical protein WD208_06750 [Dehalococcoidia bacterium]